MPSESIDRDRQRSVTTPYVEELIVNMGEEDGTRRIRIIALDLHVYHIIEKS